jgi:hypothetical protein
MFVSAPFDRNFVPYTKRRALRRKEGVFVDAGATGTGRPRVVLRSAECVGPSGPMPFGTPCGTLRCPDGRKQMGCDGHGHCTYWVGCG